MAPSVLPAQDAIAIQAGRTKPDQGFQRAPTSTLRPRPGKPTTEV
jgi:hypothetical protein